MEKNIVLKIWLFKFHKTKQQNIVKLSQAINNVHNQ